MRDVRARARNGYALSLRGFVESPMDEETLQNIEKGKSQMRREDLRVRVNPTKQLSVPRFRMKCFGTSSNGRSYVPARTIFRSHRFFQG